VEAGRENRDPWNIADPRKDCGSFVDEKLRALYRWNLDKYYLVPDRLSTGSKIRDLE